MNSNIFCAKSKKNVQNQKKSVKIKKKCAKSKKKCQNQNKNVKPSKFMSKHLKI